MNDYIKICTEKAKEVEAMQYTKDIPLEVIKSFLQDAFIKCEYGELVIVISNETKALLYGDYVVKDCILGKMFVYAEDVFNKLYSIKE